eukprot:TRINITY_DN4432_c0_g1_i1.p1 TRINITY_DN4432_c0_g1~~TRINITY_DN4432_c0_g1_i1.p1  ORF type:complete len:136 (+),score=28.28 TRINITY_DN4432_c0_g1_i1:152-559(+)
MQDLFKIPVKLLPKTLKTPINLSRVGKIELYKKKNSIAYISTLIFLKKYGPSIKYYNEGVVVKQLTDESKQAFVRFYDRAGQQLAEIDTSTLSSEDILERLKKIDQPEQEIPDQTPASVQTPPTETPAKETPSTV